jgi:hypothetical protein
MIEKGQSSQGDRNEVVDHLSSDEREDEFLNVNKNQGDEWPMKFTARKTMTVGTGSIDYVQFAKTYKMGDLPQP